MPGQTDIVFVLPKTHTQTKKCAACYPTYCSEGSFKPQRGQTPCLTDYEQTIKLTSSKTPIRKEI